MENPGHFWVEINSYPFETFTARHGDVLILKMLTLRLTTPSRTEAPRRVLRIDFASHALSPPFVQTHQ